jgi:hypothetical protein
MPVEPKNTKTKGTKEGEREPNGRRWKPKFLPWMKALGSFRLHRKSPLTDPPRRPRFTPGSRLRESCSVTIVLG